MTSAKLHPNFMQLKIAKLVTLFAGSCLLSINIFGLFINNYPELPGINSEGPDRRTKTISESDLDKVNSESDEEYFERISSSIDGHMVHYWIDHSSYSKVSLWDNYLLFSTAWLPPLRRFRNYEFVTPQLALDRGYGYCSQVAKIVFSKLQENGFKTQIYYNEVHVVTYAETSDRQPYIIDATYSEVIPYSFQEISQNLDLLDSYYLDLDVESRELVISAYASEFQARHPITYYDRLRQSEEFYYALKWGIPILLVSGFITLSLLELLSKNYSNAMKKY
jgi:hypothetical protein